MRRTRLFRSIHRLILLGCLLPGAIAVSAQIAAWDFTGDNTVATSAADVFNANLGSSNLITRGAGAVASAGANSFRTAGFQNNGISTSNTDYFQVTLGAATGYTTSLSTIDAKFNGTSTFAASPGVTHQFAYSLDGTTFTLIGSPQVTVGSTTPLTQINVSGITALQNVAAGTTITLRYYASGQTATGGWGFASASAGVYGLAIGGTVTVAAPTNNTSVQFVSTSSTASEGAGTINLALAISNPDIVNATNVTINATGVTGRVTSFTTPVIFPANSSANQNVVVTFNDNTLCDGDQVVYFTIQNVTGGQGTPTSGPAHTDTLLVTDNDALAVPVATTPSVINSNDFTATWNASAGATGYELDVYTTGSIPTSGLFFSEYVEGSSNNKYLEIYNGTGASVDLSHYTMKLFANGAVVPTNTQVLSGTLANGATIVYANSGATIYPGTVTATPVCNFSGDDAVLLLNNVTGDTLDIIGRIGQDPGAAWTGTGGRSTVDKTLVRNSSVTGGVTSNPATGFPTLDSEWGVLAQDDVTNLGSHSYSANGPVMLSGFPVTLGNVTSYSVTGLDPMTVYNFRVRATGGGCPPTANSNVVQVTTAAGISPFLTVGTLADFGAICLNADGGPFSFTVDGFNLTTADVTVAALSGFTFSTTELGSYTSSLSIPQAGGNFSQDIWVKFTPALEQSYDGDITVGGGGASNETVAATGSGINTAATMTTGGSVSVSMDQAEVSGTVTDEGCSALTDYGIEYSTTTGFTPGTGTPASSSNISGSNFSSTVMGLDACTTYYYRAYGTNNGGTAYGAEQSFTTDPIGAPVATTPGTINTNDFTATWNAVSGASDYRLDVSTLPNFGTSTPASLQEGFDGGRAGLPTGWSQSGLGTDYTSTGNYGLASPSLKFDGSNDRLTTAVLSGPASSLSFWYKGQGTLGSNSALAIEGYNGTSWNILGTLTAIPTSFEDTWTTSLNPLDNYVQFRFTYTKVSGNLSFDDVAIDHTNFVPSYVSGYEDLSVGGTSQTVTGLNTSTTYYYRVRAASGSCASGNSNTIAVTTLACPGNSFVVAIHTDANGDQTSWEILDENNVSVANGGPYTGENNTLVTETICIGNTPVNACYKFHLYDSYGDGLTGNGFWQLRSTGGRVLLGDDFADGYGSPSPVPANPSYTDHMICLPVGNTHIAAKSCGIFNFSMNSNVYCTNAPGATTNQFEFSDPDAGFIRRISVNTNKVRFSQMVTSPLTPGVKYFVRARSNAAGAIADAHFGGGCEVAMSSTIPCTELISAPTYGHSCNETRAFNTNNSFIYALPVVGATEYQFRISIPSEGYDETFIRSTYILQLKWNATVAPPLVNGSTYNVQVNVKVGTVYSGFCGNICTITIDNSILRPEASMGQANGTATMWPNPVREGQVNLSIDGIQDADQHITVDIQDIYGKKVFAKEFGNSGERFNTILDLPSDIASGVYMVNITVNGKSTVQRLSIIR